MHKRKKLLPASSLGILVMDWMRLVSFCLTQCRSLLNQFELLQTISVAERGLCSIFYTYSWREMSYSRYCSRSSQVISNLPVAFSRNYLRMMGSSTVWKYSNRDTYCIKMDVPRPEDLQLCWPLFFSGTRVLFLPGIACTDLNSFKQLIISRPYILLDFQGLFCSQSNCYCDWAVLQQDCLQMQPEVEIVSKRRPETRLKVIRDFSFLHDLQPIHLDPYSTKYIVQEGEGSLISEMAHHFSIVYSCITYDYEGKFINEFKEGRLNKSDKKDSFMLNFLLGMKIKEKSWFNVCNDPIFKVKEPEVIPEEVQDGGLIDDDYNEDDLVDEYEQIDTDDKSARSGKHYQVTVLRLQYKNEDNIEGKRLVHTQKKDEARSHFFKKQYLEALRIYRFLVDINSNCSKKHYSEEEFFELEDMANNSRTNFLRCYFKMIEQKDFIEEEVETTAQSFINFLLERRYNDCITHFLHAKWLLKERLLDGAYQAAKKSYKIRKEENTFNLMKLIEEERKNKGKIKVKVEG